MGRWLVRGRKVTKVCPNYVWTQMDLQGKVFNSYMSGLAYIYDAFQLQVMF